jgi:hypothetical protein
MSMFFSLKKLTATALFLFALSSNALAWSGFDHDNDTTIEIGPGNLVRENLEITIFDWKTNKYHEVEILEMENSFNATRIKVLDLETNKKRTFEMEAE